MAAPGAGFSEPGAGRREEEVLLGERHRRRGLLPRRPKAQVLPGLRAPLRGSPSRRGGGGSAGAAAELAEEEEEEEGREGGTRRGA